MVGKNPKDNIKGRIVYNLRKIRCGVNEMAPCVSHRLSKGEQRLYAK